MDPSKVKIPTLKDLNADNITENVNLINSYNPDLRMKFLFQRLVTHLHDFARETRLSTKEWMASINFLTSTGQISSDVRQEFILLSDVLGLSLLIDSIDHPKPPGSTDGTVLGPFHTHEASNVPNGAEISHDKAGEPLLVLCTLKDVNGNPIEGCTIDIWETDSTGHYDVQHSDYDNLGVDGRCVMRSDHQGVFWFKAIVPVPYSIPHDGPVGSLLRKLHRHPWRPSHMHFMFEKNGFDHLITALYLRGDPYENSDAVFGVKDSLVVELGTVDEAEARKYGVTEGCKVLKHDFVLVTDEMSAALRNLNAKGMRGLGLPVPDID